MLTSIKNYIKSKPRLYDVVNSLRPLEDDLQRWLDSFSRSLNRTVNFVQIGTNDGLRWDPVRRFIIRDNWSGVLVEPLPPAFDLLVLNYEHVRNKRLVFANVAVSDQDENEIAFWSASRRFCRTLSIDERLYYFRKSSMSRSFVEQALSDFDSIDDKIECYRVPCMSVNKLLSKYWGTTDIDLIFIDAEGHDDRIIRAIDFSTLCPRAIVYEAHNLGKRKIAIEEFLILQGYRVTDLAGDSVAELREELS